MVPVPSASTVYRILVRHGLVDAKARRRRREDYKRWERDAPMAMWQLDIVGVVFLADGTEVKVVTGVDDHSRYCVIAHACLRARGRAVCLRPVLAAEILAGQRVSVRIDDTTLTYFDAETRQLLRTRPSPFTYDQARRLRGARPAGSPPRPSLEPVRVQRRASNSGADWYV
jgi:hypothetical protein